MQERIERIDVCGMADDAGLPDTDSKRAWDSTPLIEGSLLSVISEARGLGHIATTRHDEVIRRIFGATTARW
jgi:hypothetical protein